MTPLRDAIQIKSAMDFQNKILAPLLGLLILTGGCFSTVVAPHVDPISPSFDDNQRNSGFIGWYTNVSIYGIITPHARDRYNALIKTYGKKFVPPLKQDYGIQPFTTNSFLINNEGLSDFLQMNQWRKDGKK